ncbi:MAG TPA: histidine kinase [Actinophytocola sp.]|uniref:sensor histidine kinase n=1 Tax=Actinophytocola sp. TaxID=1872138 RepID=UPI002DDD785B|nr:histidine kinase [Actinophytocola sp.]HEV2779425.1 histidine kinase [Actinophytocola sp.]
MRSWADDSELVDSTTLLPIPPTRLAKVIVGAVFVGLTGIGFLRIVDERGADALAVAGAIAGFLALLFLQMFWFGGPPGRLPPAYRYVALLAQAGLVYLPALKFGDAWAFMPGFLAGSMLLVLPPAGAWLGFLGVVASTATLQAVLGDARGILSVISASITTAIIGLVVYGLSRLAQLVEELHEARAEIAQMAVVRERLRFARDLHDLLGYSLSAITLKSELAHRLVTKNPVQARDELLEILRISRQALADVRTISSNYRELSLDDECRSARWVLGSADIDVRMSLSYRDLSEPVSTVLATVLREGVTNILRHSKAEWCEITVSQTDSTASIEIVNDGARPGATDTDADGGEGLQNLVTRTTELGGELIAERISDHRYRLRANIPVKPQQ